MNNSLQNAEYLSSIETKNAKLRAEQDAWKAAALTERENCKERRRILEEVGSIATEARAQASINLHRQKRPVEPVWNDPADLRLSRSYPEQAEILNVYHHEWSGIRAAASSLGGEKLAISALESLSYHQLARLVSQIVRSGVSRIVCHSLSRNMSALIAALSRLGWSDRLFLVMHGSQVQWADKYERDISTKAIEMMRKKKIRRLHVMKSGFYYDHPALFRPMLFNSSPSVALASWKELQTEGVALSVGWDNLGKNVHSNAFGAALSRRIKSIWHCAPDIRLPPPLDKKLVHKPHATRQAVFSMINLSSICLNASLHECHPMFNIEAQAHGKACIRGNLFLDALEKHPYVALTQVNDVSSVVEIRDAVDRVLSVPPTELREMVLDYQTASDAVSRQRYQEFLEI